VPGIAPCVTTMRSTSTPSRRTSVVGGLAAVALLAVTGCSSGDTRTPPEPGESQVAASSWDEIKEDGVITVGTEGTYPPFTFHEGGNGDLTGYDVEVMEAVGEELGVEVEFEETQWDAIFAGLDAGRFDVVANQVTIDDDRREDYDFSEPYTYSAGVIVVNEGDDSISSFEDLEGRTTAQSLTSNWHELAEESGADIEAIEGWAQAVTLLQQGRVDATINDELTFLDYEASEGGDTGLEVAARTEEQSESAFAFRKGSEDLAAAFDEALTTLHEDGTLAEIAEKYFGEDVSQP
jgi:cystine transport system substrate-binding protein